MIIFEISKNGDPISRLGGKFIEMIHASVSYLKENNGIFLTSTGLNEPDKKHQEHVSWFDNLPLKPGDEILLKVVDDESPNTPVVKKFYGDIISEDGLKRIYCSFCGAQASVEVQVLISQNANICHDCLRKFNPDKASA